MIGLVLVMFAGVMMVNDLYGLAFLLLVVMVFVLLGILTEYRHWNGGICRENGRRWELLEKGKRRIYGAGSHRLVVTYPFVDRAWRGQAGQG